MWSINQEFRGRGLSLGDYCGTKWYVDGGGEGYFSGAGISMDEFHSKRYDPDVIPGSASFSTPGYYEFEVPRYNTMRVDIWGAGGAGGYTSRIWTTTGGGAGGCFSRYYIDKDVLNAREPIVVGESGSPWHPAGGTTYVFGYGYAPGGYGGFNNSEYGPPYGSAGTYEANVTNIDPIAQSYTYRPGWNCTYVEQGGWGGAVFIDQYDYRLYRGQDRLFAGAGGEGNASGYNYFSDIGYSTYGGNGGRFGVLDYAYDAPQPGGGGGATNLGYPPYHILRGGHGLVNIYWY